MALALVTPPAVEPISLAEAKEYLRVDHTADDAQITRLIKSAREYVERVSCQILVTQTWDYYLDRWPVTSAARGDLWWDGVRQGATSLLHPAADVLPMPLSPVQSIDEIATYSSANVESIWDPVRYELDTFSRPARLLPAMGGVFPAENLRLANSIRIRFTAGYGDDGGAVAGDLLQAVFMLLAHWYENRATVFTGSITKEIELSVNTLLTSYRQVRI